MYIVDVMCTCDPICNYYFVDTFVDTFYEHYEHYIFMYIYIFYIDMSTQSLQAFTYYICLGTGGLLYV